MFSEYRELIGQLKSADPQFAQMVDRHDELDRVIQDMEHHVVHRTHEEIEVLKKEKLHLKDLVWTAIRKAQTAAA